MLIREALFEFSIIFTIKYVYYVKKNLKFFKIELKYKYYYI